jgi:hypothetical protein
MLLLMLLPLLLLLILLVLPTAVFEDALLVISSHS